MSTGSSTATPGAAPVVAAAKAGSQTIWNLQVLRFFAAFLVMFGHAQHEVKDLRGLDSAGFQTWDPIFWAVGVDIFFVISGFIMMNLAAERFGQPGASVAFLKRRIARIVPLYWVFTTLMLVASLVFSKQVAHSALDLKHVLASYLFIPTENPYGEVLPVLILGWTLNFEMAFYLVFAFGLMFRRSLGLGIIYGVLILMAVLGVAGVLQQAPLAFWARPMVLEFAFGISLCLLWRRGLRLPKSAGWALIAAGMAVFLYAASQKWQLTQLATRVLWAGIPALLVCAGALAIHRPGEPTPLVRALALGGDASYALYLAHPFVLTALGMVWWRTGMAQPFAYVIAASVACVVSSILIYLWFERPVTRIATRLLRA